MLLCRVTGRVDAAHRVAGIEPLRLELVETITLHGGQPRVYVACDTLGAREGQCVVTTSAGAARMIATLRGLPVDLAVCAVLDTEPGAAR
jgi:microcompartment protein CcmK/EutM